MELRKYQNEAVAAIHSEWEDGHSKTMLVLPTGAGKTIVAAKIIEDQAKLDEHVLFLAHRDELLTQASDKIKKVSNLDCAVEKAESTSIGLPNNAVVGSVQTLCRTSRLTKFSEDYFQTIIVDECHHCLADSYRSVLNYFKNAKVLGITATPDRGDKKSLAEIFDSLAYEYTMAQAIHDGYLCPIKAQMIPLQLDLKDVAITQGDYNAGQIGSALEPYLNQIAKEMLTHCKGRKTMVFLPLIKTSQAFCELLNCYGLRAAEVNGNSENREQILEDFKNGEYDVLCNSMLLTEGYDEPSVDCIVCLRPTKVRSLYQQMIGRGMRISEGKKDLLILDFLWLTERHDLCKPSSLVCKDAEIAEKVNSKIYSSGGAIDLIDANETAEKDVVREREEALARELAAARKKKGRLVDPIQYAFSIEAEDLASFEPVYAWQKGPASEKQLEALEKWGISPDTVTNAGMASILLDRLSNRKFEGLSTPKQIRYLEGRGFLHVGTWSFEDACMMIDRIAGNNWIIPYGINPATYRP